MEFPSDIMENTVDIYLLYFSKIKDEHFNTQFSFESLLLITILLWNSFSKFSQQRYFM